jgi:hypothetical protein
MKQTVVAAITAAITAYMQQEEQPGQLAPAAVPRPEMSNWRIFGLQEMMRPRTRWQVKRANR